MTAVEIARRIMMIPASWPSRERAASTINAPIPGNAKTVSTTADPPIAETNDCEINESNTGREGFMALFKASSFLRIPVDRAKSEYWLLMPSRTAFLKTLT